MVLFRDFFLQRPPSSSLSYPGAGANDDARSPGSGGTPGPLSQQAPASLDSSDPGKSCYIQVKTAKNNIMKIQFCFALFKIHNFFNGERSSLSANNLTASLKVMPDKYKHA